MLISIVIVSVWALLLLRSGFAEYKYYQAVKTLEPEIWQQLGAPKHFKIPMVFVSAKGSKLLKNITNTSVQKYANLHRQAGIQFLSYVVLVLIIAIVYFKTA